MDSIAQAELRMWDDGEHRVIAATADRARELLDVEGLSCELHMSFAQVPMAASVAVEDEDGWAVRQTAEEWITARGEGYLSSRNW